MGIGSIAGSGTYFLGANTLTVGGNNMSTTVSGSIADGGQSGGTGGSLVKVGGGTLTLTGANSYTGTTSVNGGTLQIGTTGTPGTVGTGAISIATGGTLLVVNINNDVLSNNVSNAVGGIGTLEFNSTASNTIAGTLTDGNSGQLALTQSGTGHDNSVPTAAIPTVVRPMSVEAPCKSAQNTARKAPSWCKQRDQS